MKITKLSNSQINVILGAMHENRRKGDARGLIASADLYKAVRKAWPNHRGLLPQDEIEGAINTLVIEKYLRFKRFETGYLQFFVNYSDVVRDNKGRVIGVRMTSKRWFER